MQAKTLALAAALAVVTAGCATKFDAPVPQVTDAPPAPINLADRSPALTNLSSLTYDIPMGKNLGQMGYEGDSRSNRCMDLEQLTYKVGTRKSESTAYDSVFREVMTSIGVPVQQSVQRFEGEEIKKADLQISATINDMSLNICYPRVWRDKNFAVGEGSLTIEWAVFSPIERKVIYSATTKGTAPRMETGLGEMGVHRESFRDALLNLAAKPEFADVMSRKSGATSTRADTIILIQPPVATGEVRKDLQRVRGAVVTVRSSAGEGSGFAVGDGSYVVTAAHVVSGSTEVKMLGSRDEELYGEVVRTNRARDLALIKVTKGKLQGMHVSHTAVRAGQDAYAIGSPLGAKYAFSVTRGVISGFPRIDNRAYIQSDVNVLPGSSGGPLIDAQGNVIGITVGMMAVAGAAPAGMNFFVPATELFEALSLVEKK
jgi:serine protease Do